MKILSFTDIHESKPSMKSVENLALKEKPSAIVCLGDFTVWESGAERMLSWMESLGIKTGSKVILIHGNHESEELVKRLSKRRNLIFLHKKTFEMEGVVFVGFGGGGFSLREAEFENFASSIKNLKNKKIVLLTHAPPYGTALDKLNNSHHGCKSYRDFIKKFAPVLAISGHFHENFGVVSVLASTRIANPGPSGMVFELL